MAPQAVRDGSCGRAVAWGREGVNTHLDTQNKSYVLQRPESWAYDHAVCTISRRQSTTLTVSPSNMIQDSDV